MEEEKIFGLFPFRVDPDMPDDQFAFEDANGKRILTVVNVKFEPLRNEENRTYIQICRNNTR